MGGPLVGNVEALGFIAVDLAAAFPQWVRRRKRAYKFLDESTVEIHMSVDLVLPDPSWFIDPPQPGQTIYVPLDVFAKEPLAGFSVSDGDGRAVSVLNTEENSALATEGLSAVVDRNLGRAGDGVFRAAIHEIVRAPDAAAGQLAYRRAMNEGMRGALAPGAQHEALLRDLRGGFLMLVPMVYEPGASHIFKLAWSAPYSWSKAGLGGRLRASAAAIGLVDKPLEFTESIGLAHGTHFEFYAPDDVRNIRTTLGAEQWDAAAQAKVHLPQRRVVHAKPVANVNVSVRDTARVIACRSDRAKVTVRMRPRRGGPFVAMVVLAWLTTVLIGAIAARLSELDAQSSSAVVLLLPAVLAAYMAREGEHAIASRLLAGVRVGGLMVSAMAFAAAALIGLGNLRDTAPAKPAAINCTVTEPSGQRSSRQADPQGTNRQRVRCAGETVRRPEPKVNAGAQDVLTWLSRGCALIALLLTAGLASTHIATWRAVRAEDFSVEAP